MNIDTPFFSIITVTYNDLENLKKTMKSALEQSFESVENIIIDGGSTDGTQSFLEGLPSHVRCLSEADTGIYNAMNKGLSLAQGTYVNFLNAGDYFADVHTLAEIFRKASSTKHPNVLFGDAMEYSLGESKSIYSHRSRGTWFLPFGMLGNHQAFFYKRNPAIKLDEDYMISADYDYTINYFKTSGNFVKLDLVICFYLSEGVSQISHSRRIRENLSIQSKHFFLSRIFSPFIAAKFYFGSWIKKSNKRLFYTLRR